MKLTISFFSIKLQNENDVNHNERSADKIQLFMLKLIGPFKMEGTAIMICKTIRHHNNFFMSKLLH